MIKHHYKKVVPDIMHSWICEDTRTFLGLKVEKLGLYLLQVYNPEWLLALHLLLNAYFPTAFKHFAVST